MPAFIYLFSFYLLIGWLVGFSRLMFAFLKKALTIVRELGWQETRINGGTRGRMLSKVK